MSTPDPTDAIAAALARLRGRRGPRFDTPRFGDERHSDGMPSHDDPHLQSPHGQDRHRHGSHHSRAEHHAEHRAEHRGPHPRFADGMRHGGPPAVMRMLEALAAASAPLSVSALGEAIGVDQPRASRLVQQGVERGWVRREADPDDARRTRIVLTEDGTRLFRGVRGQRRARLGEALASFTDQERADLARLLTKLADSWPD